MPNYEFELIHKESGAVIATVPLILPVDDRDKVELRRVTVPKTLAIAGAAANPHDQASGVLASYHKQEEKLGARFRSEFTPDQIKQAWATPAPQEAAA